MPVKWKPNPVLTRGNAAKTEAEAKAKADAEAKLKAAAEAELEETRKADAKAKAGDAADEAVRAPVKKKGK